MRGILQVLLSAAGTRGKKTVAKRKNLWYTGVDYKS
jgi:hypothetical protein